MTGRMAYYVIKPKDTDKCHECGEPAIIMLVGYKEDENGNIDQLPLCEEHWGMQLNSIPER